MTKEKLAPKMRVITRRRPLARDIVNCMGMWYGKHGVSNVEELMDDFDRRLLLPPSRRSTKRTFLDMVSRGELVQREGRWFVADDVEAEE